MANFQELLVSSDVPLTSDPFVGGAACIPSGMAWPLDVDGHPCMHLLSFPLSLCSLKSNRYAAAFVPYHDRKYYKQISEEPASNHSKILIYSTPGPPRNEYFDVDVKSTPRKLSVLNHNEIDTDKNYSSKLFNAPAWLQDEIIYPGHHCKMAIYGIDLAKSFEENRGLFSDGMVYVFIADDAENLPDGAEIGKVFFQL